MALASLATANCAVGAHEYYTQSMPPAWDPVSIGAGLPAEARMDHFRVQPRQLKNEASTSPEAMTR
jgi:hypothetical protein